MSIWRLQKKRLTAILLAAAMVVTTVEVPVLTALAQENVNGGTVLQEETEEKEVLEEQEPQAGIQDEAPATEDSQEETSKEQAASEEDTSESQNEEGTVDDVETETAEESAEDPSVEDVAEETVEEDAAELGEEDTLEDEAQEDTITEDGTTDISDYLTVDDSGVITKYTGTGITDISIPSMVGGKTITGIGDSVFKDHKEIASVQFPDTLTSIGHRAFAGAGLGDGVAAGTLTIPGNVTYIGPEAFKACPYLGEVVFEDVETPTANGIEYGDYNTYSIFQSCPLLTKITLSNNVVRIPDAFAANCPRLKTVEWGENLKQIDHNAFNEDPVLESGDLSKTKVEVIGASAFRKNFAICNVQFPNTLKTIEHEAFYEAGMGTKVLAEKLVIPASVTKLGYSAFEKCLYLCEVTFEDTEAFLENGIEYDTNFNDAKIFQNCPELTKITLSNNIVVIPKNFASHCPKLETVEWSARIKKIGAEAFANDSKLKTGDLTGTKVETIGENAFKSNTALQNIAFPDTLTKIDNHAYREAGFGTKSATEKLVIPSSVVYLGHHAFFGSIYLEEVIFEDAAVVLEKGIEYGDDFGDKKIFAECPELTKIKLSNNIVEVPRTFAQSCPNLKTVEWGANIKTIDDYAFENDSSLETGDLTGTKVETIGVAAFKNNTALHNVKFPSTLTKIDSCAYEGAGLGTRIATEKLVIPSSVVYFGYSAFSGCLYLGEVVFEDAAVLLEKGIEYGDNFGDNKLFRSCPELTKITLSNNFVTIPTLFASNCKKLKTVEWGENIKTIANDAFCDDISLESGDLTGTKVETIEDAAFRNNTSLHNVKFPNTLTKIENRAYEKAGLGTASATEKLTIPGSVVYMGHSAFLGCLYLDGVTFEDVATPLIDGIEFGANFGDTCLFQQCPELTEIKLSNNFVTIPCRFACKCPKLKTVEWGENVKKIGEAAFEEDVCLETGDLTGTKVEKIMDSAFRKDTALHSVKFPDTLTEISDYAYCEAGLGTKEMTESLIIPGSIEILGESAFRGCLYLNSVIMEDVEKPFINGILIDARYGESNLFSYCTQLTSIRFSNNVKSLPDRTATECPNLTSIIIPTNVESMGSRVFYVRTQNNTKIPTAVAGGSPVIATYDWASDNREVRGSYKIIYHSNNSENKTVVQAAVCGSQLALFDSCFLYTGHTLASWNTKADGSGKKYSPGASVKNLAAKDGTIDLYAQWNTSTYDIILYANGGYYGKNVSKKITLKYGDTYKSVTEAKNKPVNIGNTFLGWYTSPTGGTTYQWETEKVTENSVKELYAHWDTSRFVVNLDGNATNCTAGTVVTGKGIHVSVEKGKVYDVDGNEVKTTTDSAFGIAMEYGEQISLTGQEFVRNGYQLTGWSDCADGKGKKYSNTDIMPNSEKDITLYAQWKLISYKVTYNLDGGKNAPKNPKKFTIESQELSLHEPTKVGYTFVGWQNEEGQFVKSIPAGSYGNIALTAVWKDKEYTIVYHGEASYTSVTGTYAVEGVRYSQVVDMIGAAAYFKTKDEYAETNSIVAWSTKNGGKGKKYQLSKAYSKLTAEEGATIDLYAVWGVRSYEIEYVLDDGVNNKANPLIYTYNANKAVPIKAPARSGYLFDGWTATGDGAAMFVNNKLDKGAKGNITLTANWKPVVYTVKLNKNNSKAVRLSGSVERYENISYDESISSFEQEKIYGNEWFDLVGFNTKANGKGAWANVNEKGEVTLNGLCLRNKGVVTLYAQWRVHTYNITYVNISPSKVYDPANSYATQLRGVVNKNTKTYVQSAAKKLIKPTCTGYVFEGWYTDPEFKTKINVITKGSSDDIVVYGKWKKK